MTWENGFCIQSEKGMVLLLLIIIIINDGARSQQWARCQKPGVNTRR